MESSQPASLLSALRKIQDIKEQQRSEPRCSKEKENELIELLCDQRLQEIQKFIDSHEKECGKLCFNFGVALSEALQRKQFKVYALLQSNFYKLSPDSENTADRFETLTKDEQTELALEIRKCFIRPDDYMKRASHMSPLVEKLMLRTRLTSNYHHLELFQEIRVQYEKLESMAHIRPILIFIAAAETLEIVYDFIEKYIGHVVPGMPMHQGLLAYDSNWILISLSDCERNFVPMVVHEFIHYVMIRVYNNRGAPYARIDKEREEAYTEVYNACEAASKLDTNTDLYFMKLFSFQSDKFPELEELKKLELIVYPATLDLEYNGDDALIRRYEQSWAALYDFYAKYTLIDIIKTSKEIEANGMKYAFTPKIVNSKDRYFIK